MGGEFSAVFMRHLLFGWWLKLLHDETTEDEQSVLLLRLREDFPERLAGQRRRQNWPRWKRVEAGLQGMVPLLERCYNGCGTNPPAAEEQKDILWGTRTRVDAGQLRASYVCSFCNSYKGANIAGRDPKTRKITPQFNPRRHKWSRHFRWNGPVLMGRTSIGRTTVAVLNINEPRAVATRAALIEAGQFPPD
jgi:hypothetical protein